MPLGDVLLGGSINANSTSSTAPAAGSTVVMDSTSIGPASIQVEGTFTGTLQVEGRLAGTSTAWQAVSLTTLAGAAATTFTAPGIWTFNASPFTQIRVRATAWTSGTAVVTLGGSPYSGAGSGGGGGGGGGAVTVADGADVALGATTDAAATTDTGTFSLLALTKRLLSRLTTLLPQVGGRLSVDGSGVTQPVSAASLPLPTGAAADASIGTTNTEIGGLTETAPATDIASSGLNGRLQRVAQRLTSLIGLLPAALVGGRLDVNLGAAPAAVTLGAGAAAVGTVGVTSNVTPADRTATGAIAATNANVALTANGCGTVSAAIATNGTWNGTLTFQATVDGTNWLAIGALNVNTGAFGQTYATANTNALFQLSTAGYAQVRVIALTYTAGSATVTLEGSLGASCFPGLLDSAGRLIAVGAAAAGAALAGNPVVAGVSDGTNAQNLAQVNLRDNTGSVLGLIGTGMMARSAATTAVWLSTSTADGDTGARNLMVTPGVYNNSTFDRLRNNVDVTLLASAARTTTQSGTITTYNLGAIKFILDMTVVGTGSVTLTISETDLASGKTILLLSGAAVTTNVTNEYTVDPMVPAVANVSAQKRIPRTVFWQVTANNANSATFSLGSMQLPA